MHIVVYKEVVFAVNNKNATFFVDFHTSAPLAVSRITKQ